MQKLSICLPMMLMLLLCSCKVSLPKPPPNIIHVPRNPNSWEERWLSRTVCESPCWEGIEPQTTTVAQAKTILSKSLLFGEIKSIDPYAPSFNAAKRGYVKWSNAEVPSNVVGSLTFLEADIPTVELISLSVTQQMQINDLVKAFGAPSNIETVRYSFTEGQSKVEGFEAKLIFNTYGFVAWIATSNKQKPAITPQSQIQSLVLFSTAQNIEEIYKGVGIEQSRVNSWTGYISFDEYCEKLPEPGCYQ